MKDQGLLKAIENFNDEFQANLKELVPVRKKGPEPPKKGALKDSIKTFADIQAETVRSGVDMLYYGQYVNDGTYKMAAQPFINEAWKRTRFSPDFDKSLEKYLDKQFDKTFSK